MKYRLLICFKALYLVVCSLKHSVDFRSHRSLHHIQVINLPDWLMKSTLVIYSMFLSSLATSSMSVSAVHQPSATKGI